MMRRPFALIVTLAVMVGLTVSPTRADDRVISPGTGFQPAHSYSISDIETIDNGTGSVSLHIPITQLPSGPGGFAAGLTLSYNNRIWETEPFVGSQYTMYALRKSSGGGWHLTMMPKLQFEHVQSQGINDPCGNCEDLFQMMLINPDGSRNKWMVSSPALEMLGTCQAGTYRLSDIPTNAKTVWYTADGSYLRLEIDAPSVSGSWPNNASWTVYRQDGSSIYFDVATHWTYLRDRNGNKIKLSKTVESVVPPISHETMTDDFGRTIQLDHYSYRDEVIQKGHDGQALIWKVYYDYLSMNSIYPESYICDQSLITNCAFAGPAMKIATQLQLPNGLSYTFGYTPTSTTPSDSNYGELRTVTLPTGAQVEYGYRLDPYDDPTNYYSVLANTIATKKVKLNGSVVETWSYDYGGAIFSSGTHTAPDGGTTSYYFNTVSYKHESSPIAGTINVIHNPDGSRLGRSWAYNVPHERTGDLQYPNPWIKAEGVYTANASGNLVASSIKQYESDKNGNITSVVERDWVPYGTSPSLGTLLKKTVKTYLNGATDSTNTNPDLKAYSHATLATAAVPRNFVTLSELQNGSGAVQSRSEFHYAETNTATHSWNLTAENHWDSTKAASINPGAMLTSGNSIVKTYSYTARGNLAIETDARNITANYYYGDVTGCPANPPPGGSTTATDLYRTGEQRGGSLLYYSYGYNCNSGKRTTTTDPNGLTTTVGYDTYGRPVEITEGSYRKTRHTFNDADLWIVSQTDVEAFGDLRNVTVFHYDPLGRIRLTRQLETAVGDPAAAAADETAGIRVDTNYVFSLNRNETWTSNPYRNSEASAPTRGWTVRRLDKTGRVCVEEAFVGAANPAVATNCTPSSGTTGATTYSYDAALGYTKQLITDPAGKKRALYHDVLGRLRAVREDPAALKYDTYYEYDLLDNLTFTRQAGGCSSANPVTSPCGGGQTRSFAYDSLKRLSSALNPELGGNSIGYFYDDNGNLTGKLTSGSPGLLINYSYDSLNRVVTRDYSDGTTPAVTYCYDGKTWNGSVGGCGGTAAAPSKGRLTEVGSTVSRTSYAYNSAGQVTLSTQTTAGNSYTFGYTYTAGMALATQTYPSGRTVTTSYDDAGRVKSVKGQSGWIARDYAGNPGNPIQYASHGAIESMAMGNGIVETRTYNSRLQPTAIQAGSLMTILTCYQASDDPSSCASLPVQSNGGNGQRQKLTRGAQSWVQDYAYDAVNRLSAVTETEGWSQTYGYDAYGNRWVSASSGVPVSALTPTSSTNFNTATNRLAGSNTYDSRGNLTSYGSYTLAYDGDDKVLAAGGVMPSTGYEYDGEGRRVRAHSCPGATACSAGSGAETTVFVYDAFGRLAAEYAEGEGAWGTSYFTQDHLGSTRLETDASGQAVACHDYLPFGEEIGAGYGGRSSCFGAGDNKIKFTSKERDAETGLDFFEARYYSGAQGRFTGVDPIVVTPTRMVDPQRFNLYVYARNNPLRFVDLDGRDVYLANDSEEYRRKTLYALTRNMTTAEQKNIGYRQNKAGKYEMYVKDPSKINMDEASEGYRQLAGRIGNHDLHENVSMVPAGGQVQAPDGLLAHSTLIAPGGSGGITYYTPGQGNADVFFAEGGLPGGVAGLTQSGKDVGIAMPEDVLAAHEALAETLKLMPNYKWLQNNPLQDSIEVINMENLIRDFHGLPHRSGKGHHPPVTTITVTP